MGFFKVPNSKLYDAPLAFWEGEFAQNILPVWNP